MVLMDGQWTFSHTQLSLFRLCPRRYFYRYVLDLPDAPDERMVYSSLLVHGMLECWLKDRLPLNRDDWGVQWENFTNAFPATKLDLTPAQEAFRVFTDYFPSMEGEVQLVEAKTYAEIGGHRYVSKPDFVLARLSSRWTVDFKFSLSDWDPKPLLPYDDQLLGQAVAHEADGFIRVHLRWGKAGRAGKAQIHLTVEEQPVDPVLAAEWRDDTIRTIEAIETDRTMVRGGWTKHTGSCHAFGRPCPYMAQCKLGLTLAAGGVNMVANATT
jgi:hypothetical protein